MCIILVLLTSDPWLPTAEKQDTKSAILYVRTRTIMSYHYQKIPSKLLCLCTRHFTLNLQYLQPTVQLLV